MPFSLAGIVGTAYEDWSHIALTCSACEFASLMCNLFGPVCQPGAWAIDLFEELCKRMTEWLLGDFRALFGDAQRPKLRMFSAHLYEKLLLRGNFKTGDTGPNEALHRAIKKAWQQACQRLRAAAPRGGGGGIGSVMLTRLQRGQGRHRS